MDAPPEHATMHRLRIWHTSRLAVIDELEGQVESLRPTALSSGRVVTIGEAGLDYSLNPGEFERMAQVALFRAQIELALQLRLPLVLHIRDAHSDAVDVLRKYRGAARGVVHCFSAGLREADEYLDLRPPPRYWWTRDPHGADGTEGCRGQGAGREAAPGDRRPVRPPQGIPLRAQ